MSPAKGGDGAAKFVVSDAVAVPWQSMLRHDGFTAIAQHVSEQLTRWEADYGWTGASAQPAPLITCRLQSMTPRNA